MSENKLDSFDNCVVGAGVVGLAIARKLALAGQSVLVIDKEPWYGSGISSRNSEVIHAGIYYPSGSLKAKLCVDGKQLLYAYCQQHNIPHHRIGKLIVASSANQTDELSALKQKAEANGVMDLEWISESQLHEWEPNVAGKAALLSPSTGIIDSHALMTSLLAEIEANGGTLSLKTEFQHAIPGPDGYTVTVNSVGEAYRFRCTKLINSAGLGAQQVASNIEGLAPESIPPLYYCKGCYFSLTGKSPFNRLIYPMPEANTTGLGVHATLDLNGRAKFGPDTEYMDIEDYTVEDSRREKFAQAIRQYYPALDSSKLIPGYAGVRPKIQAEGESAKDFMIEKSSRNLINLYGIESPGLTSSLAIADHVFGLLD